MNVLEDEKVFRKMDTQTGYHQIEIKEEDKEKTTFGCKIGTFKYNKLSLGLKNAPATLQRIMDSILRIMEICGFISI